MEKKNSDIKEGLVIFIIGVIFIAIICGIIYFVKIKNGSTTINAPVKETFNISESNSNNNELNTNQAVETEEISDEDEIEITGIDSKFKELEKVAIFKKELNEESNTFEYDLDNDGYKNKLLIDVKQNIIRYDDSAEFSDLFNESEDYISHTVYVVDLNKNDSYLDVIIFSKSNESHDYFILKNREGILGLLDVPFGYGLGVNKIEAYHIYLDNNNKMLWLDEVEANVSPIVTDSYYEIGNEIKEIKLDTSNFINKEFETNNKIYFTTIDISSSYDYEDLVKNHEILPKKTRFKILGVDETGDFKVELEDGRIGYVFAKYGHL